jgi:hypothetical protein
VTAPHDAGMAADRVDRLLAQLRDGPNPRAALIAEELVRCLVQLYGAGLERIVAIVGPHIAQDLCVDPLVESLMLVHDLHPLDRDARIRRALHQRTDLGEPHYDGTDDSGVARVRVTGSSHGCRSAVRTAIESAVKDAAPEVTGVVVQVDPAPPPLLRITRRPGLEAVR